jgi:hypothetical protein
MAKMPLFANAAMMNAELNFNREPRETRERINFKAKD